MVQMILFAKQKERHGCREQMCVHQKGDLDIVVKILLCFRILAHLKFSNFSPIQFREILGQLYVNNIDKMELLYF